jgi:Tol biopolymer transport system component
VVRELDPIPGSWSPDGQVLAFTESGVTSGSDIWMLPRRGQPSVFINTPFAEDQPAFSPNGRWLAYRSDESGAQEVYVQSYPGPGEKIRVSTQDGSEPRWSRDGTTLFYRQGERSLMSVSVQVTPTLRFGVPRQVLQDSFGSETFYANYDVAPDGRRFIAIRDLNAGVPSFIVVQNWHEELKRLVGK